MAASLAGQSLTPKHNRGKKRTRPLTPVENEKGQDAVKRLVKRKMEARTPALSRLELLPVEILELIFLEVGTPNLPLSSVHLQRKLSSDRTYSLLGERYFRTFCDKQMPNRYSVSANYQEGDEEEEVARNKTRNQLLRMRWMTLERFKRIIQRSLALEVSRLQACFSIGEKVKPYLESLEFYLGDKIFIPARLLKWPITKESLEFLDILVVAGARIDGVSSFACEEASVSLAQAINLKDYRLAHRLMGPRIEATHSCESHSIASLRGVSDDVAMLLLIRACCAVNNGSSPQDDGPHQTDDDILQSLRDPETPARLHTFRWWRHFQPLTPDQSIKRWGGQACMYSMLCKRHALCNSRTPCARWYDDAKAGNLND